ncbi:hypothetical protein MSHI_00880 [Mycobacterium shinjukuense]|uniref:Uncharacterized protein n=1 Tax=Mycobacterium shinjukuense TaxID=398694 RepID=A0A7I7MJY6_9MYCO|nr:hypothetical protein MSHI_00880 [Mycobacterium shinjukuense]
MPTVRRLATQPPARRIGVWGDDGGPLTSAQARKIAAALLNAAETSGRSAMNMLNRVRTHGPGQSGSDYVWSGAATSSR